VRGVRGDVTSLDDLDQLFARIKDEAGRLDVLFANAGSGEFAPLGSITPEHFDWIYSLNVRATLFTVQKALPLMPDGSAIVLNASNSHVKGLPAFSVYSSSKAAVRALARSFSVDLKPRKIRVNSISPGVVVTPAYKDALGLSDAQIEEFAGATRETTVLGRPGTPDEIARAVLFLASDDSSYVAGIDLFVDGGQTQI
jgi:NAD(P)-dependent dehydrogenase (short-subunit alcohol dehydrogenase family)